VSYWLDCWCVVKRAGVGVFSALSGCSFFGLRALICDLWVSLVYSGVGVTWYPIGCRCRDNL